MKRRIPTFLAGITTAVVLIASLSGCVSTDKSGSQEYNNDSEYQQNVDDIAEAYGTTADEVDRMIQAVAGD